jgi:hypothetical protein
MSAEQETLATESVTDTQVEAHENQAQEAVTDKTFTQKEVDDMMARMRGSIERKVLKPYEGLGDPEELRSLREEAEKRQTEQQIKRGEFEKTLQELASKKDAEISKRDAVIKEYKVNTPLLSAAAKYNAVNAEQVKALLSSNVRLNDSGEVEVVDATGSVRYTDSGESLGVDDLVKEFLDTNPHFKVANPSSTNTKSNVSGKGAKKEININELDMRNPEHREAYKQYRKAQGLV